MNRKDFIKSGGLAAAAIAFAPQVKFFGNPADPKVKLAIIGTGARGQGHVDLMLRRDDVDLVAICDIDDRALNNTKEIITKSGKENAAGFYRRCLCLEKNA